MSCHVFLVVTGIMKMQIVLASHMIYERAASFTRAVEKMEGSNFFLIFCFLLNSASSHQEVKHLFMSDLARYDSPHGPEQIHISYGDTPNEMTIMWSTSNSSEFASSVVLYGLAPKNYSLKARGKFVLFTEGNPDGLKYIHRVVLRGLIPGMNYSYRVQSGSNISDGFEFTAKRDDKSRLRITCGFLLTIEAFRASSPKKETLLANRCLTKYRQNEMGGTFLKKWIHTRKKRDPCCTLCFNHGVRSKFKGHKRLGCPFLSCNCEQCVNGRQKRVTMKKQVRLRRKQMKDIGRRNNQYIPPAAEPTRVNFSPAVVQTESPFTEEHNTINESEKTTKNGNGGLIQSVSNILHSQFGVARQYPFNCSAYFPTAACQAQWPIGDVYLGGLKYNNWRASEQIASLSVNEPLTNPNFTVSDNSTILRSSNLYPGMESNSYRFGLRTSLEAAAVLASFAGKQKHGVPKL